MNTVELLEPIEFGSKTIEALEFRKVTAAEMRSIRKDMTFGDLLDIGQKLCGQPKSVINQLGAEDANRVVEYVGNALAGGA